MLLQPYIAGFTLTVLTATVLAAETVKAPRGWDEQYEGPTRVVSNGNSTVMIGPWQNLNGVGIDQWLTELEQQDPRGGQLISSEGVKPESVPGAFSVSRKAIFGDEEGYSVMYGCPGQKGHARLMTLDVRDGGFFDLLKGALFGEKVCKKEPKGVGSSADSLATDTTREVGAGAVVVETETTDKPNSKEEQKSFKELTDEELKMLNQQIPAANRPVEAHTYTEAGLFGGTFTLKTRFTLLFDNGIRTGCTNWDPVGDFPDAEKLASSICVIPDDEELSKVREFEPGERIQVAFRTYEQLSGYDFGDSAAYQSVGESLQLKLDGTIGNSRSNENYQHNADVIASSGRSTEIAGRYYLNGHTITIFTDQGKVTHGFVGYDMGDDGQITSIYYNGANYWDWKRDK